MSKYRFCLFLISVVSAFALRAVNCTPGELKSLITTPESVTSLTVTGEIDASDLKFIATSLPALRTLDLSEVEIVKLRDSNTLYPEKTIPTMIFAGAPFTSIALPEQAGLVIEDAAFTGAKLTTLTIPSTVQTVGVGAFAGCPDLKTVTLNASTNFSTDVFNGCTALTDVDLAGAAEVPQAAFSGCTALKTVSGVEALRTIGDNAFAGDAALAAFPFPSTLQSIGDDAFVHSGLEDADLAGCKSLKVIGERAFAHISALKSVALPNSVTSLGTGVFAMDAALAQLNLSTAVADIPDYAFTSDAALNTTDVLHSGVERIGAYAFKGHDATTTIFLPADVNYIGDHAMEGMTALTDIDVSEHKSVPELGKDVWAGVNRENVNLYVGKNMGAHFRAAAQWQDFSIKEPTVGIEDVAAPEQSVKARFIGSVLEIVSSGAVIAKVDVFVPSGQMLVSMPCNSNRVEINTADRSNNIYIVNVTLADGSRATAKLVRIL